MNKEENILGTEKIGKLIRKFSLPCIISMLVKVCFFIERTDSLSAVENGKITDIKGRFSVLFI